MPIRELGRHLGNPLARKMVETDSGSALDRVIVDITNTGPGSYQVPAGYKFLRVIAVGPGGGGGVNPGGGGGGGGCAATKTIKINGASIIISVDVGTSGMEGSSTPGPTTTATFLQYVLAATGGYGASNPNGGNGGFGTGGDYNFTGGKGGNSDGSVSAAGAGAAGPDGNGGNGANGVYGASQIDGSNGTNSGGGGGGTASVDAGCGAGPGGVGEGASYFYSSVLYVGKGGTPSSPGQFPSTYHGQTGTTKAPPGAGGAGIISSSISRGGTGLVRIEYWR